MRALASRKRIVLVASLLAGAIGIPAAISAIPTEAPDIGVGTVPRADDGSRFSVWDQPASSSPVITARPSAPVAAAPARALSANPLWEIPLERLSSTRERPVFSPSRRPPPPAVASTPPPKAVPPPARPARIERPQLSLVGTIIGQEESLGIFVDQATKAALRLKLGEDYQGWKLRAVRGREVTLERNQDTAVLTLPQPGTVVNQLQPAVEAAAAPRGSEPSRPNQRR